MVGILLLTHAPLGNAFVEAASHVFQRLPERLEAIDVWADQDPQEVQRLAEEAIARLNDGDGVLVLTDVIGGTLQLHLVAVRTRACRSARRHQPSDAAARTDLPS